MDATEDFEIKEIGHDKKRYLPLLLIGDESEPMIDRYIGNAALYIGFRHGQAIAACATVAIGDSAIEVKNLAILAEHRRQGYGRKMLAFVEALHPRSAITLGTGETPSTLQFYKSCGYIPSHRIPNFFTDNYPHPIIEEGVTLRDMIYLKKTAIAKN